MAGTSCPSAAGAGCVGAGGCESTPLSCSVWAAVAVSLSGLSVNPAARACSFVRGTHTGCKTPPRFMTTEVWDIKSFGATCIADATSATAGGGGGAAAAAACVLLGTAGGGIRSTVVFLNNAAFTSSGFGRKGVDF